jgi:flagellin-like protein
MLDLKRGKRGLSPVIAVVLLLLITIIAAGIIVAFVIPFIQDSLEGGEACFNVLGDLSFAETPYNCFNTSFVVDDPDGRVGFSVRVSNDDIVGFVAGVQRQGSSTAFEIVEDFTDEDIRMLIGPGFDGALEIPGNGEVRTYVVKGAFDKVELFPILESGAKCDIADEILITQCDAIDVQNLVGEP